MIWHILKKDWTLLWKATVAIAGLQLAFAFVQLRSELGRGNPVIQEFGILLSFVWLIASVILVVTLVQQDSIPGNRQDWLTRPIRRRDVIVAKIIFATVAVQGATIAADLVQGLCSGFPLRQSLSAALSRAALGFIAITLPALVLGTLTQSVTEAMVMSVMLIGGAFLFTVMAVAMGGDTHQFDPTNMTGVEWIPNLFRYLLILVGALIVVAWQYRSRQTQYGRVSVAAVSLIVLCSQVIPWSPVFAIEKSLATQPGAARRISLTWRYSGTDKTSPQKGYDATRTAGNSSERPRLILPLLVQDVPTNAVLKADKSQVSLFDASGHRLYRGDGEDLEIRHEDQKSGPDHFDQTVKIPMDLVQKHGENPIRIHAVYSMTLFALRSTYTMKAVNDDQLLTGWGRCRTRIDDTSTAVEMNCMQMGKGPTCATVFLEDPKDGTRNPVNTACYPDYSPFLQRPIPDATSHFRLVLPYRDPSGIAHYAVNASKLSESQIVIRVYQPIDHMSRVVTSPIVAMKQLVAP
jgi:ABC-type transport system involved in multi-copper enzyme maturation permease subunit